VTHRLSLFILVLVTWLSQSKHVLGQQFQQGKVGVNVGVILGLGTHVNRFGVNINAYFQSGSFQINPELRLYFNAKNIGPNMQSVEGVAGVGFVYAYGKKDSIINPFYSPVNHQSTRSNSFGYAFRYYFNDIETNQATGTIALEVNKFSFIAENDLFSGVPRLDRFRTGAFLLQYQHDKLLFGLNSTLFTGQMGERVNDESYPHSGIYENTIGGKHANSSNGLLSAQIKYAGEFYQTYQANIGIDSERLRHAIQNRFIHDMMIGRGINAHVPMIDDKGEQFLFKEGQKVKPMKFYLNGFTNASIFY
jgi:hypothetical protein